MDLSRLVRRAGAVTAVLMFLLVFLVLSLGNFGLVDHGVVDQSCTTISGSSGYFNGYLYQTFTPSKSSLTAFSLYVSSSRETLLIGSVFLGGPTSNPTFLGSFNFTVPSSNSAWGFLISKWFYARLSKPLDLLVGSLYTLQTGAELSLGRCGDSYARGNGYAANPHTGLSGPGPSWAFKTYSSDYSSILVDTSNAALRVAISSAAGFATLGASELVYRRRKQRYIDEWAAKNSLGEKPAKPNHKLL